MSGSNIRVLIVDDSAVIRRMIEEHLQGAAGIEVVGFARDGEEAIKKFEKLSPDLVTLDYQMPRMDGLETLDALLKIRPVPVIMVSALTQRGADVTFQAMERGALEYLAKPEGLAEAERVFKEELPAKIRAIAGRDVRKVIEIRRKRTANRAAQKKSRTLSGKPQAAPSKAPPKAVLASKLDTKILSSKCIAIGISTGGPPALAHVFETLSTPMPPIVIVQHMPPKFTASLASRLNGLSKIDVKEAETGDVLLPNHAYMAPGGKHLEVKRYGSICKCIVRDGMQYSGHKPSADVLMNSVAKAYKENCLGIIMTGMGSDGAEGCGTIRTAGGYVFGQDQESSDVYGMNKVAFDIGNVDRQFSLEETAQLVTRQINKMWSPRMSRA